MIDPHRDRQSPKERYESENTHRKCWLGNRKWSLWVMSSQSTVTCYAKRTKHWDIKSWSVHLKVKFLYTAQIWIVITMKIDTSEIAWQEFFLSSIKEIFVISSYVVLLDARLVRIDIISQRWSRWPRHPAGL